jgi:predicted GNAT superfamily acetyltransferase
MSMAGITIRECASFDDFKQCVELERSVWKSDEIDVMPVRLYQISKACSAPTFGAFDDAGRMVGFGHTMLALVDSEAGKKVAYHSHMLAVAEELRDRDIGYRIKLAQREHAMRLNVPLIFWTFDPLQSRNAHVNINKLGAVVRRYEINYYGQGVSTGFDSDVPTDRLMAEWWVASPHVKEVIGGTHPSVRSVRGTVAIPDDINAVRARSIQDHVDWRIRTRDEFLKMFAARLIVRGFSRDREKGLSCYLFGDDDEQFSFAAYS